VRLDYVRLDKALSLIRALASEIGERVNLLAIFIDRDPEYLDIGHLAPAVRDLAERDRRVPAHHHDKRTILATLINLSLL
jgi:hypothetical protein